MNYLQKKKLAFMSIVNRVKGFVRTVIGTLPLTLTNCVDEESITDYKLYGQSMQGGTPTFDTPIEVESVGEKTTNLINWDYLLSDTNITKVENGYYSKVYFHSFGSTTSIVKHLKSVLKPDVTYTLSRVCVPERAVTNNAQGLIDIKGNNVSLVKCAYWGGLRSVTFTLTQEQIDSIDALSIYFSAEGVVLSKLQLTESETRLPYEPYGYKVPVNVSGKNILNPSNFTGGIIVEYNGVQCYKYRDGAKSNFSYTDNFKENTRYTFTIRVYDGDNSKNTTVRFYYTDGTYNTLQIYKPNTVYSFTTTAGKTLQKIVGGDAWNIERYIDLTVTQLENGTTATGYEPYHEPIITNIYLDEPLRKVGDYVDYIDFENGKVVRNIEKYTFKGTEAFSARSHYSEITTKFSLSGVLKRYLGVKCISNIGDFENGTTADATGKTGVGLWRDNTTASRIVYLEVPYEYNSESLLNAYLKENEVYVLYPLAEPTETLITLPNISTFKGTSIITTDTSIQPSNAEITYYSSLKE